MDVVLHYRRGVLAMASLLDVALDCIRRGWYVFPCVPRDKPPLAGLAPHGFKDASNDEAVIRRWWAAKPDANVGIATGASGLLVVDVDHGISHETDVASFLALIGSDTTLVVRTGRRSDFGIQIYYQADGSRNSAGWCAFGCSGDIRGDGGYILAPGSIHPSGEPYTILSDSPIALPPVWLKGVAPEKAQFDPAVAVDDATAAGWRDWLLSYIGHHNLDLRDFEKRAANGWWLGIHCPWESEHGSGAGTESSTVLGILDGKLAFECSHGTCKTAGRDTAFLKTHLSETGFVPFTPEPGAEPVVVIGETAQDARDDWRKLFHSRDDIVNCPAPTFLINQFLPRASICGIAAPVAQRKSLIALNVARSLCTGEPLFGVLQVHNRPSRVLYLCPEMGLVSFSARIRAIGMENYCGETFFLQSMNMRAVELDKIPDAALDGSVVIIDTAIRFIKGDEQASKDTRGFSDLLFMLQRKQGPDGAVICLYHSPKATKDASELTLENCLRGSGELGASLTDAHGTRLQMPDDPYNSPSYIQHVKQRDYKGLEGFEVMCNESGVLTAVGDPFAERAVLNVKKGGYKSNADGKDAAAEQVITNCPRLSVRQLVDKLAELGIPRGKSWVSETRNRLQKVSAAV